MMGSANELRDNGTRAGGMTNNGESQPPAATDPDSEGRRQQDQYTRNWPPVSHSHDAQHVRKVLKKNYS